MPAILVSLLLSLIFLNPFLISPQAYFTYYVLSLVLSRGSVNLKRNPYPVSNSRKIDIQFYWNNLFFLKKSPASFGYGWHNKSSFCDIKKEGQIRPLFPLYWMLLTTGRTLRGMLIHNKRWLLAGYSSGVFCFLFIVSSAPGYLMSTTLIWSINIPIKRMMKIQAFQTPIWKLVRVTW